MFDRRPAAYRAVFLDKDHALANAVQVILADLARFCNVVQPSIRQGDQGIDPYATMVAEGRREVFLRIQAFARLEDDDIRDTMEEQTS